MKDRIKGLMAVAFLGVIGATAALTISLSGCTRETRSGLKEVGHDMGRDMEQAGKNIENAVEDARD